MNRLDGETRGLLAVAAALYNAPEGDIARLMREALAAGTDPVWIEELVLSAVLFIGYPRALVAAVARRSLTPPSDQVGDAIDYGQWREWEARGEAMGERIYGANFARLRAALMAVHPVLGTWIVTEGYGRAVGRPGLDIIRRELCAIALLVPQDAPRQLHSHLLGAPNVGASPEAVDETISIAANAPGVSDARVQAARKLWAVVRTEK